MQQTKSQTKEKKNHSYARIGTSGYMVVLGVLFSLLSACSGMERDGWNLRPVKTTSPAVLASPTANAPVEKVAAIVEPTLDANATVAASLVALKAAQDETARLQSQLADEKARAVTVLLQIAEAERETAKYNAANRSSEQAQEADRIAKVNADARLLEAANEAKRLDAELAQAQADAEDAKTRQYLIFFVSVLAICAALLVARLIRVRQGAVVEAEPQERSPFVERPVPAMGTSVRRETPPGWDTVLMATFAKFVRTSGNPDGIPLKRDEWVGSTGCLTRPQWIQLETYITETNPYAYAVNNTGSLGWTPAGEQWLALFDGEQVEPLPHQEENQDS